MKVAGVLFGILIVLGIVGAVVQPIAWENTHSTVTCTVDSKDRVAKAKGGSDMRVYSDCGVFSVADDAAQGQWNSGDTYSRIEIGKKYTFETVGWRNGFLSQFPNIIKVN